MEQKLNKSGDRRGLHGNYPKGAKSKKSKGWILYHENNEVGYFPTLTEIAKCLGKTYHYLWLLTKGKALNKDGTARTKTIEGYHIKPANVLEFSGK